MKLKQNANQWGYQAQNGGLWEVIQAYLTKPCLTFQLVCVLLTRVHHGTHSEATGLDLEATWQANT